MMKKRPWRFAILALALAGSMASVHAEELTGKEGWAARFTGDKIESNFSASQLAEAVSGLQPGDSVTINVAVENGADKTASFYLTNEVLSSLEDSRDSASGGAYGYRLNYSGPGAGAGGTDLYNSDTVGGEAVNSSGEGLHKAANGLDEYVYLDSLAPGQKGNVSLTVSLDGETQGNGYQNTFADLRLRFAAELAADNGGNGGNNGNGGNGAGNGQPAANGVNGAGNQGLGAGSNLYTQDRVYTGDANRIMVWSAVALASGLGLLVYAVLFYRKEKRREVAELK